VPCKLFCFHKILFIFQLWGTRQVSQNVLFILWGYHMFFCKNRQSGPETCISSIIARRASFSAPVFGIFPLWVARHLTSTCQYTHACTHTHAQKYTHAHVYARTQTQTHVHTHTQMHTHAHTYTGTKGFANVPSIRRGLLEPPHAI